MARELDLSRYVKLSKDMKSVLFEEKFIQRFTSKIGTKGEPPMYCWLWNSTKSEKGYGIFWVNGHYYFAHRVSYELWRGHVPIEMSIDHICRTPACVNPHHLEIVTVRENLLRGETIAARNAKAEECIHGHPFDEKNTHYYKSPRNGAINRGCKQCGKERYHRNKKGA